MSSKTWNGSLGIDWFAGGNWITAVTPTVSNDVNITTVGNPYGETRLMAAWAAISSRVGWVLTRSASRHWPSAMTP
jgi:hypothetical protein